jgi:hypothetical protein
MLKNEGSVMNHGLEVIDHCGGRCHLFRRLRSAFPVSQS